MIFDQIPHIVHDLEKIFRQKIPEGHTFTYADTDERMHARARPDTHVQDHKFLLPNFKAFHARTYARTHAEESSPELPGRWRPRRL